MISDLKPYPDMKDSGACWLGEVPEHWEVRRTKLAFQRIVGGSTPSSNETRYWGGPHVWVTPADISKTSHIRDSQRRLTQEGFDSCSAELLPAGSVVVTSRAPVGNVALAEVPFCTNQGCKALVPSMNQIYSLFAFHLFECLQDEMQSLANGTTFTEISGSRLGNVLLPLPPLPEQAAIVRYLDHVDRRVRRLTRAKRKLIALLTEQKQAIIHRAVTRGLDPDVPLKDSGVEWLGEVPEHWEVVPLKTFTSIAGRIGFRGYSTSDLVDMGEGAISLSPSNLRGSRMDYTKCTYLSWPKYEESPEIQVDNGEILLVKTGATYGKTAIVSGLPEKATINPQLVVVKNIQMNPSFLGWALSSSYINAQIETVVIGGTIPTISQSKIGNLRIAQPPENEQSEIIFAVRDDCEPIDTAITRTEREIELLSEYRTRLIADVVTGKLDVRDAAAALPEVDPLAEDDDADDLDADLDLDTEEIDEALEEVEA